MSPRLRRFALLAALALVGAFPARAAVVRGVVVDQEHREPVPLAQIRVGEIAVATSDSLGAFRIEGLPEGPATVRIEHVGFEPWKHDVRLRDSEDVEILARMRPRIATIEAVEVTTTRPDPSVPQSKRTILPSDIRRGIAGTVATDLLRGVQSLPSVAAAGDDFSNRYVVRGGDPEENLVLVDGFHLLQPIHLEGFMSVIYDDLVSEIEVYPGALPPRFGDALSSVTSMGLLPPKYTQKFFRYDLGSLALGGQTLRGPLEAIASARTSFYNLVLRRPPGVHQRSFQDFSGKLRYTDGNQATSVMTVLSRDREEGDFDRSVDAGLLGVRTEWKTSAYDWGLGLSASKRRRTFERHRPHEQTRADLERFALQAQGVRRIGGTWQVRLDGEGRLERFGDLDQVFRSAGGAVSAEGTWTRDAVAISAGARAERIPFTTGVPVSPYVSLRLRSLGRLVPGAGWRIVRQSPFHLHENPEVAGLPVDPGQLLEAGQDDVEALEARHLSASVEARIGSGFSTSLEVYRKDYRNLLSWGPEGPQPGTIGNRGTGEGKGVEISVRRTVGRVATGWISYVMSRTRKTEGPAVEEHRADYDRPRMLQGAIELPVRGGTTLSFAYRSATGRPITPLLPTGEGGLVPGAINGERLPAYRRLDVKLEHRIEGKKTSAFFYLDVLNLFNRKNLVDVTQYVGVGGEVVRINTLGVRILPVAGLGFYF